MIFLPSCWGCLSSDRLLSASLDYIKPLNVSPRLLSLNLSNCIPCYFLLKITHRVSHFCQDEILISWCGSCDRGQARLPSTSLAPFCFQFIQQSHSTRSLSHDCAPLQSCPPAFLVHCFHISTLPSKSFFFKSAQVSFSISLSWTSSSSVVRLQCSHSPRCRPLSTSSPFVVIIVLHVYPLISQSPPWPKTWDTSPGEGCGGGGGQ